MAKLNQHADEEIAPGTVVDGRYKIIRSIGQGGNGMVYEVEHTRTGRRLALKALLDQTGFARLEQEARAASLMKNGHTAKIIDMEPGDSHGPYMVMELLEGQSLRGLLDEAGQLPLELTVNIAMQVCECLHEAHGLGIIHRDLKPENVFLCASPWPGQYDVKVLDFGVMKVADGGGAIPKSSLTRTGSTVGTPYYMSLEQLRNSSAVDARADVYSLGVVLYECLSGRKPFQAETIGDLVYALCSGPPTPLSRLRPDLPAEVADVVTRTLSANRDERPASMMELATALLPHANHAFSLWVKVDGKPALSARGPLASLTSLTDAVPSRAPGPPRPAGALTPSAAAPLRALAAPAPVTMGGDLPYPPAPPVGTAKLELPNAGYPPPPPPVGLAHAPTELAPKQAPPSPPTNRSWPQRPNLAEGGQRDTPTEMFVKGVHDEPTAGGRPPLPSSPSGDRDTPTRAIELPPQRAAIAATMPSALAMAPEEAPAPESGIVAAPGPRFGAPPPGELKAPPGALQTMPISALMVPPMPAPAPSFGGTPSMPHIEPMPMMAPPPFAPPKPGWQVALDRALLGVGTTVNGLLTKFRNAPQNTQIIIVIVSVTALILVVGLIVFVIVH
jgi:serine/threonine-protein kinase